MTLFYTNMIIHTDYMAQNFGKITVSYSLFFVFTLSYAISKHIIYNDLIEVKLSYKAKSTGIL